MKNKFYELCVGKLTNVKKNTNQQTNMKCEAETIDYLNETIFKRTSRSEIQQKWKNKRKNIH